MLELKLISEFPREIIATDEVGRGPLGGPVVIGAVRIKIEDPEALKGLLKFLKPRGVKDSKKLSSELRLQILRKLKIQNLPFRQKGLVLLKGVEVSYVTWDMCHQTIDQENILAASLRGMKEALGFLSDMKKNQTTVLIDGHMKLRWPKKSPWTEIPIIKGDSKSLLIGLASIIAKEKRDAYMKDMHELYPQYGFNSHFGYPTVKHRAAIKLHGPSPIHRKTFKGVKEYVGA
ncbi:MAG TPA: ribonuclease HII [Bacteriovoracaceae bacterium]|nr:ribonuclease HII [Bacteriovoracaceae bacterium]